MALHPDFPNSPHAVLDPAIRRFTDFIDPRCSEMTFSVATFD